MTPDERATVIRKFICQNYLPVGTLLTGRVVYVDAAIAAVIHEAVAEEREACAKIAEGTYDLTGGSTGNARGTAQAIATIIRKRGEECPESSPTPA